MTRFCLSLSLPLFLSMFLLLCACVCVRMCIFLYMIFCLFPLCRLSSSSSRFFFSSDALAWSNEWLRQFVCFNNSNYRSNNFHIFEIGCCCSSNSIFFKLFSILYFRVLGFCLCWQRWLHFPTTTMQTILLSSKWVLEH